MTKVHNWQLGREMEYPYEAAFPKRQFAFVFNINRCIGCQTCSMACKSTWTFSRGQEHMWWNNVETKPYGGYPRNWDSKLLAMLDGIDPGGQRWKSGEGASGDDAEERKAPYGEYAGRTIFETPNDRPDPTGPARVLGYLPDDDDWDAPNMHEDVARSRAKKGVWGGAAQLPEHDNWFFYLQRICNHCSYPGCLAACPRQAIYKRPEDGVVLIDQERCRGYRKCVAACPYKKSLYRPTTRTSEKCIACYPRLEGKDPVITPDGAPIETRCMTACVGKIRMQGLVKVADDGTWERDPENPIYYLVHEEKVALPIYPQFGTQPNGFYIPPRWVPRAYLQQMFGPGVGDAIDRYALPSRRLLGLLQLFRVARKVIFRFEIEEGKKIGESTVTMSDGTTKTQAVYDDVAIGYDGNGKEMARVGVREQQFERPSEHVNSI